ncbi:MAG: ATP-dependent sacrificial sulfur transferase LarE [Candidatus Latescibacteria bacterium]|nr:ATP-dependent sacrificial sulfur transferase LarE [Candidatus Latescibacterota bacterium]
MTVLDQIPVSTPNLDDKLAHLERILGSLKRVLIGYSGGVDSAMLIVAANRVLGQEAMAVTADSESYASGELEAAQEIARQFGVHHIVVRTEELANPDYASNPVNRCFFCKQELFTHMDRLAEELEVPFILYGQNADDVGDFRPGAQAAAKFGVRAPLQEAGLAKSDVRELARRWGLSVWDRPAMACLASRFPYGTPVTAEGLRMIDRAEAFLRARDFAQLRVRHHVDIARVELPDEDVARLLADRAFCQELIAAFAEIGYVRIVVDLRGFRSGSMNEALQGGQDRASADAAIVRDLQDLGLAGARWERQGQMLCLQVEADDWALLVEARAALVEKLEGEGCRYIAVDLALG